MKAVNVYRPLENALSDFDRYFESFFGNSLSPAERMFRSMENRLPAVDVRETEKVYVMEMELPGYDEKNIEIRMDNGNLSIESKIDEATEEKKNNNTGENYLIRERRQSAFRRSFKLPENADNESVSAVFKNGILSLEIGKKAEAQAKVIQIKGE
jgi:HSP20 family protein